MQYIDAAMVGHLGTVESSAIGLMATSTWLFGSLCTAGVAGFSIQLAQYIGAKNDRKAREILWQSYFVCLFIATVLALIAVVLCPFLPGWLGGGARRREGLFRILPTASHAISKQGSTGKDL